jgi:hypothetical protein
MYALDFATENLFLNLGHGAKTFVLSITEYLPNVVT